MNAKKIKKLLLTTSCSVLLIGIINLVFASEQFEQNFTTQINMKNDPFGAPPPEPEQLLISACVSTTTEDNHNCSDSSNFLIGNSVSETINSSHSFLPGLEIKWKGDKGYDIIYEGSCKDGDLALYSKSATSSLHQVKNFIQNEDGQSHSFSADVSYKPEIIEQKIVEKDGYSDSEDIYHYHVITISNCKYN